MAAWSSPALPSWCTARSFVGRRREMAALEDAWTLASTGARPVVFVGQLAFQRENLFNRTLHNETACSIQRQLPFTVVQVNIMQRRVWGYQNAALS